MHLQETWHMDRRTMDRLWFEIKIPSFYKVKSGYNNSYYTLYFTNKLSKRNKFIKHKKLLFYSIFYFLIVQRE